MSNILLTLPSLLRLSMAKHGVQSYTTGKVSPLTPLTRRDAFPWPDELPGLGPRPVGPTSAAISAYVATLGALWAIGAEGPDADRAEIRRLLDEVAGQCDELGATFALAVSRQASRDWSAREGRCAFCGLAGIFHDPDSGEELHIGTARR